MFFCIKLKELKLLLRDYSPYKEIISTLLFSWKKIERQTLLYIICTVYRNCVTWWDKCSKFFILISCCSYVCTKHTHCHWYHTQKSKEVKSRSKRGLCFLQWRTLIGKWICISTATLNLKSSGAAGLIMGLEFGSHWTCVGRTAARILMAADGVMLAEGQSGCVAFSSGLCTYLG